jgi:hypothetical protein
LTRGDFHEPCAAVDGTRWFVQLCIAYFAFFISTVILLITNMIRIMSRMINAGFVALALLPVFRQCADAAQNGGAKWSWQEPQAKVLPTGDLEWTPKAFQFKRGKSVRYIDFEAGDDLNDGLSKEKPWKHHPWDPAALGQAKLCCGIHTYIFKQGIVYRGQL